VLTEDSLATSPEAPKPPAAFIDRFGHKPGPFQIQVRDHDNRSAVASSRAMPSPKLVPLRSPERFDRSGGPGRSGAAQMKTAGRCDPDTFRLVASGMVKLLPQSAEKLFRAVISDASIVQTAFSFTSDVKVSSNLTC
jgi:hypothetical protein